MSERNFSRRRRGGMRFRPSGGFNQNQKPDRSATEARAEATGEKKPDARLRARRATTRKLSGPKTSPPACRPEGEPHAGVGGSIRRAGAGAAAKARRFPQAATWRPRPKSPRRNIEPVRCSPSRPTVDRQIGTTRSSKSSCAIKQEHKTHKEIIINAESLETRVALQEDGRLEEFTIERTTEERLVGQHLQRQSPQPRGRPQGGVC